MADSYDLTQMDPHSFENMVNYLALGVLGRGATGFGPGSDGGRDGYFEGEASYPSERTRWSGKWYIQSKFHKPHLSKDPQKWLIAQVRDEISLFKDPASNRKLPDNWIFCTNIEPSGVPQTGSFDAIRKIVKKELGPALKFDIWGGRKLLDLLGENPGVASYFGHFLTPGNVLTILYDQISDSTSQVRSIVEHLVVGQFNEQLYTKMEQAGSSFDNRPKLYELFVDLPFSCSEDLNSSSILAALTCNSATTHKVSAWSDESSKWKDWLRAVTRSRIVVLKGGPGQGKSTVGQYFSQIHRAALILGQDGPTVTPETRQVALRFRKAALAQGFWSDAPRIPITIELKDFAAWFGSRSRGEPTGILSYICERISFKTEQTVLPGTMKRALKLRSWFVNFDGLDEVPNDVKEGVAAEVRKFTNETLPIIDADVLILCTTRPQGYAGQFDKLDASTAVLSSLPPTVALSCASAVLAFDRSDSEAQYSINVLENAMQSEQVLELMTTPLQSHIMAVVVRDGGRPPEKRWELFDNFYKVMKKRESQKDFQDRRISKLLREDDTLLKAIHARLGVTLHVLAEESQGAETTLNKEEFQGLAERTASALIDGNVDDVVGALMEATTERLVFVNTPENSSTVRFDVRQLQEFFAGEFIYSDISPDQLSLRLEAICNDSHWREVMHFVLSALVFNGRRTELTVASQVLVSADANGGCHNEVLFWKRLAVGAMLGIRLLNEGVLEQDKRLRQLFVGVLTPLYALSDLRSINLLTEKKHVNSHSWLLNSMIEHLFKSSEAESLGAAISLIISLPSDHPRLDEVSARLFGASDDYLEAICDSLYRRTLLRAPQARKLERVPAQWFLVGLLKIIMSPTLRGCFDYSKAIRLLRAHVFVLAQSEGFKGLSVTETKLVFALMDVGFEQDEELAPRQKRGSTNYKGLSYVGFQASWLTGKIPENCDFTIENRSLLGPILQFAAAVIDFARSRDLDGLRKVHELSLPLGVLNRAIAPSFAAMLPLSSWRGDYERQFGSLFDLSSDEFAATLSTGRLNGVNIPWPTSGVRIEGDYSATSWANICRDYPLLALEIWMQDIGGRDGFYSSPECVDAVMRVANDMPEAMAPFILGWGKLFSYAPDAARELRRRLLSVRTFRRVETLNAREVVPFVIDLQIEGAFLPMLAEALLARIPFGDVLQMQQMFIPVQPYSGQVLESFGLQYSKLRACYLDESAELVVRQSALALNLAKEGSTQVQVSEMSADIQSATLMESVLIGSSPFWLVKSVAIFCNNHMEIESVDSRRLIGRCLYIFRENYAVQLMMQNLLNKWRENSSAPVRTKGLLDPWLAGEK